MSIVIYPTIPGEPDSAVAAQRMGWGLTPAYTGPPFTVVDGDPDDFRFYTLQDRAEPRRPARFIRISPATEYVFDAKAGSTSEVVLAEAVSTVGFQSGVLAVRFHQAPAWTSPTAQIFVEAYGMTKAQDEPQTVFASTTAAASINIRTGELAPGLFLSKFAAPIADSHRVVLRWLQGAVESTGEELFKLAVELVGRT